MTTRRNILKGGAGLAAILASGKAPATFVKSMLAARNSIGMKSGGAKLPYDAEVEWLKSVNGDGYIDTGLTVNNFYLSIKTLTTNVGTNTMYMFGAGDTASGIMMWRPGRYPSTHKRIYSDGSLVYEKENEPTEISDLHITASSLSHTLVLFNARVSDGSVHSGNGGFTCYYLTIKDANGNKLRDMIPVRFTNELGQSEGAMYDKVSGQLFRNQGTGAFLYGRDTNPISARSYVNDGLVAMWDGIENAGWGLHDPNATTWKDLTGNGYDLELRNSAHFDINSLVTAERNKVSALLDRTLSYRSIEVCGFADESRNSSGLVCFGNYLDSGIMLACYWNSIQTYNGNYQIKFTNPVSARSTWSGTHDGLNHIAYVNGDVAVGTVTTNNWSSRAGTFGLSGSSNYNDYNFVGNYYCVRLYSRALTAAEVAANYAVDKERFNLA